MAVLRAAKMWECSEGFWLNCFFHSQKVLNSGLISYKQLYLVIQVCTIVYAAVQLNLYACGMTT